MTWPLVMKNDQLLNIYYLLNPICQVDLYTTAKGILGLITVI